MHLSTHLKIILQRNVIEIHFPITFLVLNEQNMFFNQIEKGTP